VATGPTGLASSIDRHHTAAGRAKELILFFSLKFLMIFFEKLSDMRINYHKIDITPINLNEEETQLYVKILCCKIGSFPFIYFGVPLHHKKFKWEDIQPIVDKIMKRIMGWKGKLLSYGARVTLLKTCLASIPINNRKHENVRRSKADEYMFITDEHNLCSSGNR
jgi:hypothetical protein